MKSAVCSVIISMLQLKRRQLNPNIAVITMQLQNLLMKLRRPNPSLINKTGTIHFLNMNKIIMKTVIIIIHNLKILRKKVMKVVQSSVLRNALLMLKKTTILLRLNFAVIKRLNIKTMIFRDKPDQNGMLIIINTKKIAEDCE